MGDRALVDMLRSYAGGFIFTTSLPPPVLAAARASVAILKSAEGRELRAEHRRRVATVRRRLQEAGLPAPDVPSHIIPVFVSTTLTLCKALSLFTLPRSNLLLSICRYQMRQSVARYRRTCYATTRSTCSRSTIRRLPRGRSVFA